MQLVDRLAEKVGEHGSNSGRTTSPKESRNKKVDYRNKMQHDNPVTQHADVATEKSSEAMLGSAASIQQPQLCSFVQSIQSSNSAAGQGERTQQGLHTASFDMQGMSIAKVVIINNTAGCCRMYDTAAVRGTASDHQFPQDPHPGTCTSAWHTQGLHF